METVANGFMQALNHLNTNSAEAMNGRKGRVRLSVGTLPAPDIPGGLMAPTTWKPVDGIYACLTVADTGCGIPQPEIPKLFDPFFTTEFTGRDALEQPNAFLHKPYSKAELKKGVLDDING